jgi:hypothetical protein
VYGGGGTAERDGQRERDGLQLVCRTREEWEEWEEWEEARGGLRCNRVGEAPLHRRKDGRTVCVCVAGAYQPLKGMNGENVVRTCCVSTVRASKGQRCGPQGGQGGQPGPLLDRTDRHSGSMRTRWSRLGEEPRGVVERRAGYGWLPPHGVSCVDRDGPV